MANAARSPGILGLLDFLTTARSLANRCYVNERTLQTKSAWSLAATPIFRGSAPQPAAPSRADAVDTAYWLLITSPSAIVLSACQSCTSIESVWKLTCPSA